MAVIAGVGVASFAESFVISTPGGPVTVDVGHAGPGAGAVSAPAPVSPDFRPPTIFSAPLRSGSGGRALALGGAFTAVADDATAASWNPAGLIQLENPEASFVFRASRASNRHDSSDRDYTVEDDTTGNLAVNYMSYVQPVRLFDRNFVFSINYQEDYDFTQEFHAKAKNRSQSQSSSFRSESFTDDPSQHIEEPCTDPYFAALGAINTIDVTSHLTTLQQTSLREQISSGLASDIDFEQQGVIDAITLAGAAEITPSFALGAAFNVHGDNTLGGNAIRSRTTTRYKGTSVSEAWQTTTRTTTGTYEYDGNIFVPPGGIVPIPLEIPISGSGTYDPFTDSQSQYSMSSMAVDGKYSEVNEFNNLRGYNATFGAHWITGPFLTLGFALDLPWTARANQRKTIRNKMTVTTTDETGATSTTTSETVKRESKDVEFDFPLYWSLGGLMRWTDRFYTSTDISQTQWSQFSYKAQGQGSVNPLDGTPSGQHELDDCWAVRQGAEYLWPTKVADIAFRGGLFWEQRPAIGTPDNYFGGSLGLGLSMGKERQVILDVAWMHTMGFDVMGSLVPGQELTTDVAYDELYMSVIYHF
jgi:long-subunit fatty acid transport protein